MNKIKYDACRVASLDELEHPENFSSDVYTFVQLAMAPAGDRVVCIEGDSQTLVVVRNTTDGSKVATYNPDPCSTYSDPSFSPNGTALAFLSYNKSTQKTTLWTVDEGQVNRRVTFSGIAQRLRYSPCGKMAALILKVSNQGNGLPTHENLIAQQLIVCKFEIDTSWTHATPPETCVYDFDWIPNNQGFIAIVADDVGDNGWYTSELRYYDLNCESRTIAKPAMQIASPKVSPDGMHVAFIGGLMSDATWPGGDIFIVAVAGGDPLCITPGLHGSFTSLHWRAGQIIATALLYGTVVISQLDPASRRITEKCRSRFAITAGRERIALDAEGIMLATVIEHFDHAPEIAVCKLDRLDQTNVITSQNAHLNSICTSKEIHWDNDDLSIQGWILTPILQTGQSKHPLVMVVHGGPAHASTPRFPALNFYDGVITRLLESGYYIFLPNPRGSYGQGREFVRANVRDFGGGDYRDLMSGLEAVLECMPIDKNRIGIIGHSYGGFLAMWTVTQTGRFKAAIAGGGISNWLSYFSQTSIENWMIPYFGKAPYFDPGLYDRVSPVVRVNQVTTPTLLYVGDCDDLCPKAQSVEFWRALKYLGVATDLHIFPREGHEFCEPEHIRKLTDIQFSWLNDRLKPVL